MKEDIIMLDTGEGQVRVQKTTMVEIVKIMTGTIGDKINNDGCHVSE